MYQSPKSCWASNTGQLARLCLGIVQCVSSAGGDGQTHCVGKVWQAFTPRNNTAFQGGCPDHYLPYSTHLWHMSHHTSKKHSLQHISVYQFQYQSSSNGMKSSIALSKLGDVASSVDFMGEPFQDDSAIVGFRCEEDLSGEGLEQLSSRKRWGTFASWSDSDQDECRQARKYVTCLDPLGLKTIPWLYRVSGPLGTPNPSRFAIQPSLHLLCKRRLRTMNVVLSSPGSEPLVCPRHFDGHRHIVSSKIATLQQQVPGQAPQIKLISTQHSRPQPWI